LLHLSGYRFLFLQLCHPSTFLGKHLHRCVLVYQNHFNGCFSILLHIETHHSNIIFHIPLFYSLSIFLHKLPC
jgi:hypothetical protein